MFEIEEVDFFSKTGRFFFEKFFYSDIINRETFCSGDVVMQETLYYGELMLRRRFVWRRFVEETFRVETFCMCADILRHPSS
jgi:hypothetical protein